MKTTRTKRKLLVHWYHSLLWLGKYYTKFKQTFFVGFYDTPQDRREQNRIIKQAKHYNRCLIKPGDRYRSVVLAGRRF